jgi:4-hydroxybenzoate polyprenyltransferase
VVFQNLKIFSRDIKLSHSVFALPFVGVVFTFLDVRQISWAQIGLILVCMVFARSFAMGANRFLDRDIDVKNSRTVNRALPQAMMSSKQYLRIILIFGALFIGASFLFSVKIGFLSPLVLVVLAGYSLMKRFTLLTHWYLGICLGLAPLAAELALRNELTLKVLLIGLAVCFWTAGFDLLYALQDTNFDIEMNLHSVPSILGPRKTIWLSRISFFIMVILLFLVGQLISASYWWNAGIIIVSIILTAEHWLIRDAMKSGESQWINTAFFNLNALVSILFFLFALANRYA